jgi:hypothetical protein
LSIRKSSLCRPIAAVLAAACLSGLGVKVVAAAESVDFNRDVRRILSENCFRCHGPDTKEKGKAGGRKPFRLDLRESATADLGDGRRAVDPGHPERSELVRRVTSPDADEKMPPPETGKKLTTREVATLKNWIQQGAEYARHWAYVKPERPAHPRLREKGWARNGVDEFILARLEAEKWKHAPEADRPALIRRAALDLTGLPPSLAEVDQFLADRAPDAYERAIDRLLAKPAYGEHWARWWLDQARYADSSGYADDPVRTIWAYRDYVIRAFNENRRFDRFTIEQLAGDLLDDPTDEQLVATAFHRNTMTNNEGGTNDEEYRNVAIVDRVNTTMAVWMGTTMACAQCHNHKYDPISQEEYFKLFAVLNNTADADRSDETPVLSLYNSEQKRRRQEWQSDIARLEKIVRTSTPELEKARATWEENFKTDLAFSAVVPTVVKSRAGAAVHRLEDGSVRIERSTNKTDVYTVELPAVTNANGTETWTALRLDVLPDETMEKPAVGHADGNFVVSRVLASVVPVGRPAVRGRFVRVELPGKEKFLSLAEVQVFSGTSNVALRGEARQSSTAFNGPARLAIDGKTDGRYEAAQSTTHTESSTDPWWEVDLKSIEAIDRVMVWNRTDSSGDRLKGFRLLLLDEKREVIWRQDGQAAPSPSADFRPNGARSIAIATAAADFSQQDFNAADVLDNKDPANRGWAVSPQTNRPHALTLTFQSPVVIGAGSNLVITIEHLSKFERAAIARFSLARTADERAPEFARVPATTLAILRGAPGNRAEAHEREVREFYLTIAPGLQKERGELAGLRQKLADEKAYTTTPILRELPGDKRRETKLQRRGNFLDLGPVVREGLPVSLAVAPSSGKKNEIESERGNGNSTMAPANRPIDRRALAQWLVDTNNPLTARVTVNRLWESIFGVGLVRTSEEFGAQGERPSHPELLDWLAVEFMDSGWDVKHILRLMVTSAAYRQSSRVTSELAAKDPENRLLARGPRFRLTAEMVRDQALAVAGLLSSKMYGPPVKPPQPKLGLSAAFGSATDWETSGGEDRYRRALYTTWRRSNPYPSMATFDAPNREVCLVRRERSNTPLQALVTLNDPVYLEAAQALARRMAAAGKTPVEQATYGFRVCLSRLPEKKEMAGLIDLYGKMRARFQAEPARAVDVATKPLGAIPEGAEVSDLAAWTMVANVLLNLDEMLMKR